MLAGKLQEYGWTGRPFASDVANELGITAEQVVLLNDCAAGANAERGARKPEASEMGAFMVVSTGIGGALYDAERVKADEPGHEVLRPGALCGCGQDGHFEAHVAGSGIMRKFNLPDAATDGKPYLLHNDPRWAEVKADFHNGMVQTLERYQREHGWNLNIIGFTGSVALGGPNMLVDLQDSLDTRFGKQAPRIDEAFFGEQSGLYGAMFAAAEALQA